MDRYYLARFKNAQDFGVYEKALKEIKLGRKTSHWMWFIFPQLRGLGYSQKASFYGITCANEARAYLEDPVLGSRLREISEALTKLEQNDPQQVMGNPDWLKLNSCMTLFDYISPNDVFQHVLKKFYNGIKDIKTIKILSKY
jgi:uncharacterized protein (DUF1810 family)